MGAPASQSTPLGEQWLRDEFLATLQRVGPLTDRQVEVLEKLLLGATHEHIAGSLGIAVSTVHQHIKNARRRLGADSVVDFIRIYIRSLDQPPVETDREIRG